MSNYQQREEENEEITTQSSTILAFPEGAKVLLYYLEIPQSINIFNDSTIRIQSILLPESLEAIEEFALSECPIESIVIPNGVKRIGVGVFSNCTKLRSVTLSQGLKEIESSSFNNCISLKSIIIPNGVTKIGNEAFQACEQLQSITLPDNLKEIEDSSFNRCTSLQSVNILNGVTQIGQFAFSECSKLHSVTLPQTITEITHCCFIECFSLRSIIIPNGVTIIREAAFCDCPQLQSVVIPESLTKIEEAAFASCSTLQMIALPEHAIVEEDSFSDCVTLNNIHEQNTNNLLKTRFDHLLLHQLCYNINNDTTDKLLASIKTNNEGLEAVDTMGMTPLHLLCSNPSVSPNIIKHLVLKNHNAVQVRNVVDMTPLHIYLIIKHVISSTEHQKVLSSNDLSDVSPKAITLLQDGAEYNINDMIGMGLEYEVMDVTLTMNERRIEAELSRRNETTGLYSFMIGAISDQCRLADVYKMAIGNIDIIQKNETSCCKKRKRI